MGKGGEGMDWSLMLGLLAIIAAVLNVVFTLTGRDSKGFMYDSLSFTLLTLCFSYENDLKFVAQHGLDRDVIATPILFGPVLASIAVNSIGLFGKRKKAGKAHGA